MNYSFDCAQFIVANSSGTKSGIKTCKSLFDIWGNTVLCDEQIHNAKNDYIKQFCDEAVMIFELTDKEFHGEFEDWEDLKKIPARVLQFESCVKKVLTMGLTGVKVFIVEIPSRDNDRIFEVKTNINHLSEALYKKSFFYTEDRAGCEVLIVNV